MNQILFGGEPYFTVHGDAIKVTSTASKMLRVAGSSRIGELWDSSTSTWKDAEELIENPNCQIRNGIDNLH